MIATILAAGLAGALTIAGVSAASSSPAVDTSTPGSSTTIAPDLADQPPASDISPEDCEQYAKDHGWSGHDNMDEMMGDSGFMDSMSGSDGAEMGSGMGDWADTGTMGSMGS